MPQRTIARPTLTVLVSACVLLLISTAKPAAAAAPAAAALPAPIEQAETDALQWLLRQMTPNEIVSAPDPGRRRLLLSYSIPAEDPAYRYLHGRSYVYDDALCVIAYTLLGCTREAEFLLNALGRLVRADGSLWFGYNTQNDWPSEGDHEGAIIRTGAVAWVGYAFTFYLGARSREQADFLATDALAPGYLRAAQAIAGWLLARQVADRADPRAGLLTGGAGTAAIAVGAAGRPPEERYDPAEVRWASTEHNMDAWFFLRDLARMTASEDLAAAAETVRSRLMRLWSEADGQFLQGILAEGAIDKALPLDGASWGALFLAAQGRVEQARKCVAAMQDRFTADLAGTYGYRPYGPEPVYTDPRVNAWFFPGAPGKLWNELAFVWGEGSLGAAAALARTGREEEALRIMDGIRSLAVAGGLRYSSAPVAYQFMDYPSVASTAWYIIAAEVLRGGPVAGSFWGP